MSRSPRRPLTRRTRPARPARPRPVEESGEVDADADVAPTDDARPTRATSSSPPRAAPRSFRTCRSPSRRSRPNSLQNSGATDIRQLNQLAPSLLVSSTGTEANGSARIRGIGTVGDNPGLESSVAVFVDGVYRSRSGIGLNELGEIERIEVLRGPQGTLFGRNASAGLIHIISKKPNMNEFEGFGSLTYGNYDYIRVDAGITGPIGETLGFRLDGVYARRDGFYDDVNNDTDVNDRNRLFVRGQLLFEPSADALGPADRRLYAARGSLLRRRLSRPRLQPADRQPQRARDAAARRRRCPTRTATTSSTCCATSARRRPPSTIRSAATSTSTPAAPMRARPRDWGLSGEVNWDIGGARP